MSNLNTEEAYKNYQQSFVVANRKMRSGKINQETKQKIIKLHSEGLSASKIIKRLKIDICTASIYNITCMAGLKRMNRIIPKSDYPKLLEMYKQGLTTKQIASEYNVSRAMISLLLKRNPDYEPRSLADYRLQKLSKVI